MNHSTPVGAPLEIEVHAGIDPHGSPVIRFQWQEGDRLVGLDLCPTLAQTVARQLMQAVQACAAATKGEKTP